MEKTYHGSVSRPQAPCMNKVIVLESYKAACIMIDWVRAVISERMARETPFFDYGLGKWSFLEYLSKPEVVSYEQIEERERLLQILAGLELALLLSAEKDESFAIRREWQKLWRWMGESQHMDPAVCGLSFITPMGDESKAKTSKILTFMIEHMPELRSGWSEGGADALNDYLYVLWLEAKER